MEFNQKLLNRLLQKRMTPKCYIMRPYKDVTDRIGYRINRYNLYGIYYALAVVVHQMRRIPKYTLCQDEDSLGGV